MNWDYIAGFADGEGYFGLTAYDNRKWGAEKKGWRIRIDICQKTEKKKVMEDISEFLNEHGIKHSLYNAQGWNGHTPMTHLVIGSKKQVKKFLDHLFPKLIVKQEDAKRLLDFCINPKGPII